MKRALCEQSSENKENRSDPGNMPQAAGGRRTKVKRGAGVDVRDELYTSLIEQLECPICMHPYTERVFVCRNGHSICAPLWASRKVSIVPAAHWSTQPGHRVDSCNRDSACRHAE